MGPGEVKRKLTAILSADVKGYSRLMGEDEVGTIRTLTAYKEVIAGFIQSHRGRVVSTAGDSLLAEFASVVDAVQCAVEIQKELKTRNADLPESRRMEFRIGINLGDVVEEREDILGDGVNIASRVESLAEAGGICISGMVHDQIKNKLALSYEYLGEQVVKNIAEPVRVYRVRLEPGTTISRGTSEKKPKPRQYQRIALSIGILLVVVIAAVAVWKVYWRPTPLVEVGSPRKAPLPLPDKPSIAVLPFTNMSDDPKQEFFADGLAEEIINALAKLPQVFVIARNSSFTYKGKAVDVKLIGRELGVQYVLEGSVRKETNRVRITAQLVDATTGRHVFSERYDRELKEIFATQDEIAIKVLNTLRVAVTDGEIARFQARGVSNLEAYLKLMEAFELTQRVNKESNDRARRLAEEALALEPSSARAHTILASVYFWDSWLGPPKSAEESMARGIEMAKKAIGLDDFDPTPHGILGLLYVNKKEYDKAVEEGERAVTLAPNFPPALTAYGSTLMHSSRPKEAIPVFEKLVRLSPLKVPSMCLSNLAASYRMIGRYEDSVLFYKKLLGDYPDHWGGLVGLTITYSLIGRQGEARAQAAELLRVDPKFSLERYAKIARWKDPADLERNLDALRKAGLK